MSLDLNWDLKAPDWIGAFLSKPQLYFFPLHKTPLNQKQVSELELVLENARQHSQEDNMVQEIKPLLPLS